MVDKRYPTEGLGLVDKFYRMDPAEDDLLFDGSLLKPGMRVLIEDNIMRSTIKEYLSDWELDRALTTNRWCTIEQIRTRGDVVSFVAVYDGEKKQRTYSTGYSWLVKKDSLPKPVETKHCGWTECSVDNEGTSVHRGACPLNNPDPNPTRTDIPVYVPESSPSTGISLDELDRRTRELM